MATESPRLRGHSDARAGLPDRPPRKYLHEPQSRAEYRAGYAEGARERRNEIWRKANPGRKAHSAKWDRCATAVRRRGSAAVPEAVCTKSLGSRAYNPRDPEMRRAAELYKGFRERVPQRIKKIGIQVPRVAVDIGQVEYIGYRTTHGRKLTLYQHDFAAGSRPLLCVSPDGKQLLLIGGRYRFTERGIVDRDLSGREIDEPAHGKVMRK